MHSYADFKAFIEGLPPDVVECSFNPTTGDFKVVRAAATKADDKQKEPLQPKRLRDSTTLSKTAPILFPTDEPS